MPVTLEMLGGLRLTGAQGHVPVASRKSRALIAYLALAPHMSESRVRLAGLLWSEKTDGDSRVSLRQQIMRTRIDTEVLNGGVIKTDRLNVWIDAENVSVDVINILRELDSGRVPDVLIERRTPIDDFLKDLDGLDPAFDYWMVLQRESLREQVLRKLHDIIAAPSAVATGVQRAAMAIHNLDPTNEEACRLLMRQHAEQNDMPGALRIYNELWQLLDVEFDVEPAEETQALVAQIKLGEVRPATTGPEVTIPAGVAEATGVEAAGPQEGHVLILVEPFTDEGIGETGLQRVSGLRHELIAALTRFRDWSVREAGSAASPELPLDKKVYEIVASAVQEADEIFVTLMLRRQADQTYLWSQRCSLDLTSWAQTKLSLIRRIATSLEVRLSADRLTRTATAPDQNLDIYDRWLRGNILTYSWHPEDEVHAEAIFRSIIAEDPSFAPAYSSLVSILNNRHNVFPGIYRDRQRAVEALDLARVATKLDSMDSRGQLSLAWSHILNDRFEQAALYYDLALQMNENDPWTMTSVAQGLAYCGEKERARSIARHALEVAIGGEPIHWCYQTCVRVLDEDYEGAVEAAEHAEGTTFFLGAWKASALAHLRRYSEARETVEAFYRRVSEHWFGQVPVSPQAVLDWISQCFPIRYAADRERFKSGVVAAGLLEIGK